ncbi:16701_t:CDS:2 [Gigaspora rosea]|nr:16701_t:CDS:2 [Gigaspora rosea]
MAQYQLSENTFATVYWKHFDTSNNSKVDFSVGDIVSIAGKFVIENSDQFITIASVMINKDEHLTNKSPQYSDNDEQEQKTKPEHDLEEDEIEENSILNKPKRKKKNVSKSKQ